MGFQPTKIRRVTEDTGERYRIRRWSAARILSTNNPETNEQTEKYSNPGPYPPVWSLSFPKMYGPRKPPRLPNELISPRLAAAAALPRKTLGRGQNPGCPQ